MRLVICSSAAFYKHACDVADNLEAQGIEVVIPETAQMMRESGDFNVDHYKTWYKNEGDFHIKKHKMDTHFKEVETGDAILVINDKKHGIEGYVGPNVLMEMTLAYYLKKPIFILNNVGKDLNVYEEVFSMGCVQLGGNLKRLQEEA